MTIRSLRHVLAAALALAALSACSSGKGGGSDAGSNDGTALVGTFRVTAGSCSGSKASGSYFRMINPGGTIEKGKFFGNPDSSCADKSYTLVAPGSSGGFTTGSYQADPTPPFDATGNGRAGQILAPTNFTAIKFTISTNRRDPQTKTDVPEPSIRVKDGKLSGQLTAWSAAWNNEYFNQGAPKPDGSTPGLTATPSGSYDATTHHFVLTWASRIVGGPFNGFTGSWHLEGTFVAAK